MAVVTIEELDPEALDEATLTQLAELTTVEELAFAPDDPPVSPDEEADELRLRPDYEDVCLWVARDPEGRLLGRAGLWFEHRPDNQHLAELWLVVRPDARRQGIGRRLFDAAAERARAEGRTTLVGITALDSEAAVATKALGAEVGLIDRISRLHTAEVDRALLDAWIARAPERAAGYSLVAWDDHSPDELLEQFAALTGVMNTAPRGELDIEDEVYTPEMIREFEGSMVRKGTKIWTVAARHDATGELVGYTALFLRKHRPWHAQQGDTAVDPAHRDKGLGRWLKAVNLRRLLEERPAVRVVDTGNASSNEPMLNINVALGFRPLAELEEVQAKLSG
jgi:GNAT superfamily N-acetyltransferase